MVKGNIAVRIITMMLAVCFLFTGCGGYTDASVEPPSNWATYDLGSVSFKFYAGWSPDDTSGLVSQIDANMLSLGGSNDLMVLASYISPIGEQGTYNYLTVSYYTLGSSITGEDLESIMDPLNALSKTLKTNMALSAEIKQNARIRHYGEYDALTMAYQVGYGETECLIQTALVPVGRILFQISYSDFTTVQDDQTIEQLLTSISFDE